MIEMMDIGSIIAKTSTLSLVCCCFGTGNGMYAPVLAPETEILNELPFMATASIFTPTPLIIFSLIG